MLPGGGQLSLSVIVGTTTESRRYAEFLKRMLDRIGVRIAFETIPMAERMKRLSACRFQVTTMDWGLDTPDGSNVMLAFYGKSAGNVGLSCLEDPAFDADYERLVAAPLGAAREPIHAGLLDRLDALMPVRPIPYGDAYFLTGGRKFRLRRRATVGPPGGRKLPSGA